MWLNKLIGGLLILVLSLTCSAQKFKGGITGGISASQIDGDGYGGFNKAGFVLGGFVNTDLSEKWIGQFEINYTQKGSKDPPNHKIGKFNITVVQLDYIEIPVLVRHNFNKIGVEGGLYYGRLVRNKQRDANGQVTPQITGIGPFKGSELGYQLGLTYNLNDKFLVSWRQSASVLPIANRVIFDRSRLNFFGGAFNIVLVLSLKYQFVK